MAKVRAAEARKAAVEGKADEKNEDGEQERAAAA